MTALTNNYRLIAALICVQLLVTAGCTTTCKVEKDDDGQPQIIIMEW